MTVFLNNFLNKIVLSSVLEDPREKCCREKGVPDVCFGYCMRTRTHEASRFRSGGITGICEKWLDEIGECRQGNIYSLLVIE